MKILLIKFLLHLNSLIYKRLNEEVVIELSKTDLKYEWSIDKQTDTIKNLEQGIRVKDQQVWIY